MTGSRFMLFENCYEFSRLDATTRRLERAAKHGEIGAPP